MIDPFKTDNLRGRFRKRKDRCHEHILKSSGYHGKWFDIMRNLREQQTLHLASDWIRALRKREEEPVERQSVADSAQTLTQMYGRRGRVIGRGVFGDVRIACRTDANDHKREQLFAVKELKQRQGESVRRYYKRLIAEFCLSSPMHHVNVVATLDLLQDTEGVYCQVMECCSGGDLHTMFLATDQLDETEADCFFKQLLKGVEYIHEMGVAHRDLKPENILLTERGMIKITDFGNAECFRTAWERDAHMSAEVCGSTPYIAPEEYVDNEFDPRAVDVWACGVIYVAMRTGQYMWRLARISEDGSFDRYVKERNTKAGYEPTEVLRRVRPRCLFLSYALTLC
jgi:protein-serine/threonine kinase